MTTNERASPADSRSAPSLALQNISKGYRVGNGQMMAIDDITLDIKPGEFISVIGPSGCGKSTLFRILGGLVSDWSGVIAVDGTPVMSIDGIGMVFQEESTFPWRTVRENVELPLEKLGLSKIQRREKARHFLDMVGLIDFEDRFPAQLSGGMRQRTALARTLAFEPRILLMDEPFAALDEQTRMLLGDKILELHAKLKQTTLLITHNITEAVQLSDRVAVMTFRPGRIKRVLDVALERPRSSDIVSSEQFGKIVASIWADLRLEASKGLAATEKNSRSGR